MIRPSMRMGERRESRPAERAAVAMMRWTAPAFAGPLARYRAIDAAAVARAMHHAGREDDVDARLYEGKELFALARSEPRSG